MAGGKKGKEEGGKGKQSKYCTCSKGVSIMLCNYHFYIMSYNIVYAAAA